MATLHRLTDREIVDSILEGLALAEAGLDMERSIITEGVRGARREALERVIDLIKNSRVSFMPQDYEYELCEAIRRLME